MARANNYDFMRITAAVSVIVSHQFALFGLPEPLVLQYQTLGGFGVLVFFSISGYLVGNSWDNDPAVIRFSAKRLLRIWPAYILSIFLCMFVVGPLFTSDGLRSYFASSVTWSYLKNIVFLFQPFLPGVFSDSPVKYVPNGVYWTLPIEMTCYLFVACLGFVGLLRNRYVVLAILLAVSYWYYVHYDAQSVISSGGPRYYYIQYATFFFYGLLLGKFRDVWIDSKFGVLAFIGIVSAVLYLCGERLLALFLILPYALNAFGESSTPFLRDFGRFGDPSYGLYIYAFPIQQIVLHFLGRDGGFAEKLILVMFLAFTCSLLSWKFIEHPALKLKPKRSVKS